jgi:hypothetical protein
MGAHDAFLDRAATKLDELARRVGDAQTDDRRAAELSARIRVQREKLAELRRAGAEITPEMTQSFAAALDQLSGSIGTASSRAA